MPGLMMELELRFGDLIATSLDAAGIEDALTRMEMCNVSAATLYDRIADLGHQALAEGEEDYVVQSGSEDILELAELPVRGMSGALDHPLGLPRLVPDPQGIARN